MKYLIFLSLFLMQECSAWTDICKDGFNTENECCQLNAPAGGRADPVPDLGMEAHEYEIQPDLGDYMDHQSQCLFQGLVDSTHSYHLINLETRKEYTCVMKWLMKEQGNFGPFYIGLKADAKSNMKNMFEWEYPITPAQAEMTYTSWAPTSPKGAGDCVFVQLGQTFATSGLWTDGLCTALKPSICERRPKV